ncbi:DUF4214 domain-containing protein [Thiocystis violacea]|uniref:DUF4214 domain-containing protein n=1 Tax=Thiocystis violacea TaxID=13725 RepID=UPI001908C745|nr:DUF4214 domain-containing protein [Thiocystis violacea]MBK1723523.1 hypothetical protein [Thiocystis violacea]
MATITYANGVKFDASVADIFGTAYLAAFGRAPVPSDTESANDPAGLPFWVNQYLGGSGANAGYVNNLGAIGDAFVNSNEFESAFGTTLTDAQFVQLLYTNLLGRSPDPGGFDFWLGQVQMDGRGAALMAFADSNEFAAYNSDLVEATNSYILALAAAPADFAPDFNNPSSLAAVSDKWLADNPGLDPMNDVFNVGSSDLANFAKQPSDPNGYLNGSDFGQDIVSFDLTKPFGHDVVLGMILADKFAFDANGRKQGDIISFTGVSDASELAGMIASVELGKDMDASNPVIPDYRYEIFFGDKDFWDMTVTFNNGDSIQFIDFIADDANAFASGLTAGMVNEGDLVNLIGVLEANDNIIYA